MNPDTNPPSKDLIMVLGTMYPTTFVKLTKYSTYQYQKKLWAWDTNRLILDERHEFLNVFKSFLAP